MAVTDTATVSEVLAACGAAPDETVQTFKAALAERAEHIDEYGLLQFACTNPVVVIEPNGWTGADPRIAEHLTSNGGHFFAVHWSPVAYQIVQARDGHVIGRFDPNFIGMAAGANDLIPGWLDPDNFPPDRLRAASLAALEHHTGVRIDQAWLTEPLQHPRILHLDAPASPHRGADVE